MLEAAFAVAATALFTAALAAVAAAGLAAVLDWWWFHRG